MMGLLSVYGDEITSRMKSRSTLSFECVCAARGRSNHQDQPPRSVTRRCGDPEHAGGLCTGIGKAMRLRALETECIAFLGNEALILHPEFQPTGQHQAGFPARIGVAIG